MDYAPYWLAHLRPHNDPYIFPRQVAEPWRSIVVSEEQYVNWILKRNGKKECYTAVYSQEARRRGIIDTVLTDIDDVVYGLKLWRWMLLSDIHPRAMYSGKGIHLFMDFKPIVLKDPAQCIRDWADKLPMRDVMKVDIDTKKGKPIIDPTVIGDINRCTRIPYTFNTRVKPLMSFYLPDDVDEAEKLIDSYVYRDIIRPPGIMPIFHDNVPLSQELLRIDSTPPVRYGDTRKELISPQFKSMMHTQMLDTYPACIREYIETIRDTGELDHYQRLQLVTFLNRIGYDEDSIVQLFKEHAKDFSERITRYQIRYVIRRNLKVRGCVKAIQMGICPFKGIEDANSKCPYFPSMNWWT